MEKDNAYFGERKRSQTLKKKLNTTVYCTHAYYWI